MKATSILIISIVVCALFVGLMYLSFSAGEKSVQIRWDEEKSKMQKEIDDLTAKQTATTNKVVKVYVNKVKSTDTRTRHINDAVVKYVPPAVNTNCKIPNNVITLLDASARNIDIPKEFQFKLKMDTDEIKQK